jgi:hypothetical protein
MSHQPGPDIDRFARRISQLKQNLQGVDPFYLANRTGASYLPGQVDKGEFQLSLWGSRMRITFPAFDAFSQATGEPAPDVTQALLLYYFNTADGTPLSSHWISFADLPDGRFYNQAFQGYTGGVLARVFQNDKSGFEGAAAGLGGVVQSLGDSAFTFQALPFVMLLIVFWQGDEDFPSSYQILFDASSSHYLPTDAFAILGSTLTRRMVAAYKDKK